MTESTCFHEAKKMYCQNNRGWGSTCSRLKTEKDYETCLPAGRNENLRNANYESGRNMMNMWGLLR